MRKQIKINPHGGQVLTNVRIEGLIVAGYYLQIFEVRSNNVLASFSGHNEFDDDDLRALPNSPQKNIGRVIMLNTTLVGIDDTIEDRTYKVSLEIHQDGELLDAATEEKKLNNNVQESLIIVKITD